MATKKVARPAIPLKLYRASNAGGVFCVMHSIALFFLPALGATLVFDLGLPAWQTWPVVAVCVLLSACGALTLGFVGHEGTHLSLFPNRYVSALIGVFFSAALPTYCEMGFAVQHWNHHRFTNQDGDPDVQTLRHLNSWWQRLLFARITYNFNYARTLLRILLGRPLGFAYRMPFKDHVVRRLAAFNVVASLVWLAVYALVASSDVRLVMLLLVSATLALILSGAQSYLDHGGIADADRWRNTRTRASFWASVVWVGNNYHLEHHLYPGVPAYRLHEVHRLLKEKGYLAATAAVVDHSFWHPYRSLSLPYAAQRNEQKDYDPHERPGEAAPSDEGAAK